MARPPAACYHSAHSLRGEGLTSGAQKVVVIGQSVLGPGWNEIDAVELIGDLGG
ncbi:MAG: hypothetical protein ACRDG5_00950 [Anaerolineales bacterium]